MCKKIETLLKEKIGLDVNTVGEASIQNAIKRCLKDSSFKDVDHYYQVLLASEDELKRLVEAVVVPETWFFRDDVPFDVLTSNINSNWLMPENSARTFRILSIPCSTGEEPYTIAMALDKINFPVARVQIDAVDISQHSLDKAKKGVYRENSFRSMDLSFRDAYFTKIADGYRLKSRIRKRVNFRQGNLLRDNFSEMKGGYDVIFCRNLLIYFDNHDQQLAVSKLYDLLASDGVLFVGHAEANNNVNHLFRSLRMRGSFAFVKKCELDVTESSGYDEKIAEFSKKYSAIPSVENKTPSLSLVSGTDVVDSKPFSAYLVRNKFDDELDEHVLVSKARRLADEGSLEEAEEICQQALARFSSADAFYLLGVVYEATNRSGMAESMFRKAIYLVPSHTEALVHLALHVERNGSVDEALSLRRRAERARQ